MFGLSGQNWMPVTGGGLLIYIGALAFVRRRQTRAKGRTRGGSAS